MQFTRIASVALFFLSFGLLSLAAPTTGSSLVARCDTGCNDADVLTIVTDLQATVKADVAVFATLLAQADVQLDAYVTALAKLTADINASVNLLVALPGATVGVQADAIAQVCADILIDIFAQLDACIKVVGFVGSCGSLDAAIAALLAQLNVCVSGVLIIIAKLCVSIKVYLNVDLAVFVKVLAILSPLWVTLGL